MLTQEFIKQVLDYDRESGQFTWLTNCRGNKLRIGSAAGTKNAGGYIVIRLQGRLHYAHRLAWLLVYGDLPAAETDHINGIRDDNSIKNLRSVDHSENGKNQAIYASNTSGVIGVVRCTQTNKWRAQIGANGKQITTCRFVNFDDAVSARKELERKHGFHANHGRANQNIRSN